MNILIHTYFVAKRSKRNHQIVFESFQLQDDYGNETLLDIANINFANLELENDLSSEDIISINTLIEENIDNFDGNYYKQIFEIELDGLFSYDSGYLTYTHEDGVSNINISDFSVSKVDQSKNITYLTSVKDIDHNEFKSGVWNLSGKSLITLYLIQIL